MHLNSLDGFIRVTSRSHVRRISNIINGRSGQTPAQAVLNYLITDNDVYYRDYMIEPGMRVCAEPLAECGLVKVLTTVIPSYELFTWYWEGTVSFIP